MARAGSAHWGRQSRLPTPAAQWSVAGYAIIEAPSVLNEHAGQAPGCAGRSPGNKSRGRYSSIPVSVHRWKRPTCSSGHSPSQGIEPSRRRSRIAVACSLTSSYDDRSKAHAMDSWSTGRNSGLMSCVKVTRSSGADTATSPKTQRAEPTLPFGHRPRTPLTWRFSRGTSGDSKRATSGRATLEFWDRRSHRRDHRPIPTEPRADQARRHGVS
jgi:hypothetical protein